MSSSSLKRGVLKRVDELCDEAEDPHKDGHHKKRHSHKTKALKHVHQPTSAPRESDKSENRKRDTKISSKDNKEEKPRLLNKNTQDDCIKGTHSEAYQSHVNAAFQNDDGSDAVTGSHQSPANNADMNKPQAMETIQKTSDSDGRTTVPVLKLKDDNAHVTDGNTSEQLNTPGELVSTKRNRQLANSPMSTTVHISEPDTTTSSSPTSQGQEAGGGSISGTTDGEMGRDIGQTTRVGSELYPATNTNHLTPTSANQQVCVDNVQVVPLKHPGRAAEHKLARPISRSNTHVLGSTSSFGSQLKPDAGSQSVARSYSMRIPSSQEHPKSNARRLLRDLSFSDSNTRSSKNYGKLRAALSMPRRKLAMNSGGDEDSDEDAPIHLVPELETHLMSLMHELLGRGKVRQVAVLEHRKSSMLVSLPPWQLPHSDQVGLVKAVTCSMETMLRLTIGDETYSFFKHGRDKMMGRSGESILVAQKTIECVVVGVACETIPGSCLYEVSELARALISKGW